MAILFDVDDTLYDASIPFCSACDKVFKEKYSIPSIDLFLAGRIHDIPVVDRIRKAFSKFGIQITESEVMEFHEVYRGEQTKITLTRRNFHRNYNKWILPCSVEQSKESSSGRMDTKKPYHCIRG